VNKQQTKKSRGIEWTDYTWNPIGGCSHECRWKMPDGTLAICYAETVAERVASYAYPRGFAQHYWRPERLQDPLGQKKPSRIFLDSMSDLMGAWVPEDQIRAVLDVCNQAPWHSFQLLTKNAPRLMKFSPFPPNVWVGVSSPPDFFLGKELSQDQKVRFLDRSIEILHKIEATVKWMSFEPLSWDVSSQVEQAWKEFQFRFDWAVIGAATNGREKFQPDPIDVQKLLTVLDATLTPVFFKGNLEWDSWREDFPGGPMPKHLIPTLF
jgi:protein gp37